MYVPILKLLDGASGVIEGTPVAVKVYLGTEFVWHARIDGVAAEMTVVIEGSLDEGLSWIELARAIVSEGGKVPGCPRMRASVIDHVSGQAFVYLQAEPSPS